MFELSMACITLLAALCICDFVLILLNEQEIKRTKCTLTEIEKPVDSIANAFLTTTPSLSTKENPLQIQNVIKLSATPWQYLLCAGLVSAF